MLMQWNSGHVWQMVFGLKSGITSISCVQHTACVWNLSGSGKPYFLININCM